MLAAHVAALVCAVSAAACALDPVREPIARISTSPTAILARDNFRTRVTIDGRASAAVAPPDTPLSYAWQFEDDEARSDDELDSERLVVTFRGERPPRIVLTVTTPDGIEGVMAEQLPLTVR